MQIDKKFVFTGFVIVLVAVLMFVSTMLMNNREYARMALQQETTEEITPADTQPTEAAATLSVPEEASSSAMVQEDSTTTTRSQAVRCDEAAKQRLKQTYTNLIAEENKRLQQSVRSLQSALKETGPFAAGQRNEEIKILHKKSKERLAQLLETHKTELGRLNCPL